MAVAAGGPSLVGKVPVAQASRRSGCEDIIVDGLEE